MFLLTIPKRSSHCFKGGEILEQGEEYHSILIQEDNQEGFQRQDYCNECWLKNLDSIPQAYKSCSWKSLVPLKTFGSDLPKQRDERALYLLKEALSKAENHESSHEAFVLALYLARRRLIVLRGDIERKGQYPLNIYEVYETEETLCVPNLSSLTINIEKLQIELAKKFQS